MKNRIMLGICIVIFVISIIWCTVLWLTPNGTKVNVIQDGEIIKSIDLSETGNMTFDVEYKGRKNTIQIEDGKIRVLEAECPDKICVNMGWLDSAVPIVCLPNLI